MNGKPPALEPAPAAGSTATAPESAGAAAPAAPNVAGAPATPPAQITPPAVPVMVDAGTPALDAAQQGAAQQDAAQQVPRDAAPQVPQDEDAGPDVLATPRCENGSFVLAPGFLLSQRVDYVEDRNDLIWPARMSSAGTACANAKDRASCMESLNVMSQLGRHLVTTAGDRVQFWSGEAVFTLFGLIDTPAEAIWVTQMRGFTVACEIVKVSKQADGFLIDGVVKPFFDCAVPDSGSPHGVVHVQGDGLVGPRWTFEEMPGCMSPVP